MVEIIREYLDRLHRFEEEIHDTLAYHDASSSRVYSIEKTYRTLEGLSLKQDQLFREALRCVEHGLFRSAHVMAWAGFMDFLHEMFASDGFQKLHDLRPKWSNISSVEELRESISDYQVIEAAKDLGFFTRNQIRALHGLLGKRNDCAHPSDYNPDFNETLGYISELFNRLKAIQQKAR